MLHGQYYGPPWSPLEYAVCHGSACNSKGLFPAQSLLWIQEVLQSNCWPSSPGCCFHLAASPHHTWLHKHGCGGRAAGKIPSKLLDTPPGRNMSHFYSRFMAHIAMPTFNGACKCVVFLCAHQENRNSGKGQQYLSQLQRSCLSDEILSFPSVLGSVLCQLSSFIPSTI